MNKNLIVPSAVYQVVSDFQKETYMDYKEFFHGEAGVYRTLFRGSMTRSQVAGCERIIHAFCRWEPNGTMHQLAYILATSYHETARRMQPVRETLARTDEEAIRKLDRAWARGQLRWVSKPYWRDGWFGRGDVQLTHERNYKGKIHDVVKKQFGADIHKDPSKVLDPEISAYILIEGMMLGDTGVSDFTSFPLEQFVSKKNIDYELARRSVNPGDLPTYRLLAAYAIQFEVALMRAGYK